MNNPAAPRSPDDGHENPPPPASPVPDALPGDAADPGVSPAGSEGGDAGAAPEAPRSDDAPGPEARLSPEEQAQRDKDLKRERVRRNLRIIGLAVAAYYFISAGMSWYEEHEREKFALEPGRPHLSATSLNTALRAGCQLMAPATHCDTWEPVSTSTAMLGDGLKGAAQFDGEHLSRFTLQLPVVPTPEMRAALKGCLAALENSRDLKALENLAVRLGFPPDKSADTPLSEGTLQTPVYTYELRALQGAVPPAAELTLTPLKP